MNFSIVLEVSRNGRPHIYRFDSQGIERDYAERTVKMFRAGELPMESTVTFGNVTNGDKRLDDFSWRWADVKDIRIEDN